MKITYLGHSAFLIEGDKIKALIDPFIKGNPDCTSEVEDLNDITHIFVTHGHSDHLGDTIEIAKNNNAQVICNFEIGLYLSQRGVKVHTMHIGGKYNFGFGSVKMTPALHGSGIDEEDGNVICGGNACGFLIQVDNKKIYHAGDTGLTMDMMLLKDENIDVAILPIGGNYTMDVNDAVKASEFINAKNIIPMHYNTFAVIKADVHDFAQQVKNSKVHILQHGEIFE